MTKPSDMDPLLLIAEIAEGSGTVNSLQHIAKIAREELKKARKRLSPIPFTHGEAHSNEAQVGARRHAFWVSDRYAEEVERRLKGQP